MKIYTKTGDKGVTSLYDGTRLEKHSFVFDLLGEMDELSCRIGMLYAILSESCNDRKVQIHPYHTFLPFLKHIQQTLQDINSHIATINEKKKKRLQTIDEKYVQDIEYGIDEIHNKLPPLSNFILPGTTQLDAQCHLCRTQTRKVERMMWKGNSDKAVLLQDVVLKFMNRLSDYFFTLSRLFNEENLQANQ